MEYEYFKKLLLSYELDFGLPPCDVKDLLEAFKAKTEEVVRQQIKNVADLCELYELATSDDCDKSLRVFANSTIYPMLKKAYAALEDNDD